MIFYKGKSSKVDTEDVKIRKQRIEKVTEFKYLGMWLTPHLRVTNHIKKIVNKARGKIGYIFEKLNISFLPMKVALQVFNCYILPIITYGLAVWWGEVAAGGLEMIDAVFSEFLKRWWGLPYAVNNAYLYHMTNQIPLTKRLDFTKQKYYEKLRQQLSHLDNVILTDSFSSFMTPYCRIVEKIPSYFWSNPMIQIPQSNKKYRVKQGRVLFGWNHFELCRREIWHQPYLKEILEDGVLRWEYSSLAEDCCVCKICNRRMEWNHTCFYE